MAKQGPVKKPSSVVTLTGTRTIENIIELKNKLDTAVSKKRPIILDFSGLEKIDMSFIQLLMSLWKECQTKNIQLTMTGMMRPSVQERFAVTGLCEPDKADASILTGWFEEFL